MILTKKQTKALDYLEDKKTIEVYYGGAAGGGKTGLGTYWQFKNRMQYPGSRGLMGRATRTALKETTLTTFLEISKREGAKRGVHFDLTSHQDKQFPNCVLFANQSVIYLKDLFAYPADPDFDELGSLELTDAFIDEAPQVTEKAKNIVRSRIRYKLNEYALIPKMLMCGNPSKNWAYREFYMPNKMGSLSADKAFVRALPNDNPHLPASYLESLKGLDKNSRERLLYGNWEYDDDPAALILYEKILSAFTNKFLPIGPGFITCDVARFGKDKTVIGVWFGFRVRLFVYSGLKTTEVSEKIQELQKLYNIDSFHTVADEDGVGGGVVDQLGCKGFVNNSRPLNEENFNNLKSQCYFKLADRMNADGLFIECDDPDIVAMIIQELEQVKDYKMDQDGKKQVMPKEKVKEMIGRSPDFADTIMMREYFELSLAEVWQAF